MMMTKIIKIIIQINDKVNGQEIPKKTKKKKASIKDLVTSLQKSLEV